MEFFRIINISSSENQLRTTFELNKIELLSTQIFLLDDLTDRSAAIGSLWGEFTLLRDEIKGGLRFSLLECPNALAWTITTGYPPAPNEIVLHLSINRTQIDPGFKEEIEEFLNEQCIKIKEALFQKT